jgi:uncharacterized membrane protein YhaH (DUF805 family)
MWRWQGTIDRKTYAVAGCSAFVLKYFLDKFVAFAVFGRSWFLWSYWEPLGPDARVNAIHPDAQVFAGTLLVLALPFIWLGATLTVQRLRDAGKPLWLVVFFFVPVINLLFFLLLCTIGSHSVAAQREAAPWPKTRMLDRWIRTKHAGGGSNGDRDDDCDWFHVYRIGDGGAAVLRLGVVCGAAVLPGAVFGAVDVKGTSGNPQRRFLALVGFLP